MEIQITQEQVDAVIEALVRNELNNIEFYDWDYEEYRKQSLRDYVLKKTDEVIDGYLKEKFDALIDDEVAEVARMEAMAAFLAKPVRITDGYRKAEYDSWSSYLLKQIHEHSLTEWNVNKKIRDEVDKRVRQLWEECSNKAKAAALASFCDGVDRMFPEGAK